MCTGDAHMREGGVQSGVHLPVLRGTACVCAPDGGARPSSRPPGDTAQPMHRSRRCCPRGLLVFRYHSSMPNVSCGGRYAKCSTTMAAAARSSTACWPGDAPAPAPAPPARPAAGAGADVGVQSRIAADDEEEALPGVLGMLLPRRGASHGTQRHMPTHSSNWSGVSSSASSTCTRQKGDAVTWHE